MSQILRLFRQHANITKKPRLFGVGPTFADDLVSSSLAGQWCFNPPRANRSPTRIMQIDSGKMTYGLGLIAFGGLRVFAGLLLLWGQVERQKPGTVYGFLWPHNIDEFLSDLQTVSLLIGAFWLIRTGIWGEKPKNKAPKT